ncbi:organic hydroperoxide resistance protein [Nesterenkonia natronophila]|uniref:Organic hydroperoxide resistance protein n=1 Tax=Nesterenkonia natronophila TaxID=2174932 RepID=A0A3A4FCF0_9MICC|nr:organic hydroperoxide resistance protein [Nesterenkonia natronophila]RJN32434.1 organic hydroperoxide resistance protein [Nesterenkonia natronophila]
MAVDVKYTAEALASGDGRNGQVKTADGSLDLRMAAPKEMGGSGEGNNPEELFAAGYAACFHGALRKMAGEADQDVTDSSVGVKIGIGGDNNGGMALAATIEVVLPNVDKKTAEDLAQKANDFCPYSKATRGNIDVEVIVTDD